MNDLKRNDNSCGDIGFMYLMITIGLHGSNDWAGRSLEVGAGSYLNIIYLLDDLTFASEPSAPFTMRSTRHFYKKSTRQ